MEEQHMVISDAFKGDIRWVLAFLASIAFFIGVGGGAGLSFLLAQAYTTWQAWMHALPGAGWAMLVALAALWLSMSGGRRWLFLPK